MATHAPTQGASKNMSTITMPLTPPRSLDQRRQALDIANATRSRRAQLKRDLKAGRESVAELILHPPVWAETMKVSDAMLAAPKLGRVKVNKVLVRCRISGSKTLGGITERQRDELLVALRLHGWKG